MIRVRWSSGCGGGDGPLPALAGPPPEFPAAYSSATGANGRWQTASWELGVLPTGAGQTGVPAEKLVVVPLAYEAVKETTGPRDYELRDRKAEDRVKKVESIRLRKA